MGFFRKPRVKQEVASPVEVGVDKNGPKRLSPRQYKAQKKNDRKGNTKNYASKKEERSYRIEALLEQRSAHRHGSTFQRTNRSYDHDVAPVQAAKKASDVGFATATIATKNFFSSFWS